MDAETFAKLRRAAELLPQLPDMGYVEIADGQLVMMMAPRPRHEYNVLKLEQQLNRQLAAGHPGYVAHGGADLEDIGLGRMRRPDVMVLPEDDLLEDVVTPENVLLVIEVVSKTNPENDYLHKVDDYAAMGVPNYLIIDPRDGTGIVHSQPKYTSREKFAFGDTITVGPWTIDTGELRTYR